MDGKTLLSLSLFVAFVLLVNSKDLYDTLGVAKSASDQEIKRAYHKMSLMYHPDKNPDDPSAEEKASETGL